MISVISGKTDVAASHSHRRGPAPRTHEFQHLRLTPTMTSVATATKTATPVPPTATVTKSSTATLTPPTATATATTVPGRLRLHKEDAITHERLEGACFTVTGGSFNSTVCDGGAGDSEPNAGTVAIHGLTPGVYTVIEVTAPDDYVLDSTPCRHYLLWYADDPQYYYCFNPVTQLYWGRWCQIAGDVVFQDAEVKASTVEATVFTTAPSRPLAPNSEIAMAAPPDLAQDALLKSRR